MNIVDLMAFIGVAIAGIVLYQSIRIRSQIQKSMREYAAANKDVGKLLDEFKKFKVAFDYAYDAILITDPEGQVLYCNDSFVRVTGFTRKQILSAKAGKLWGGLMPKAFYKRLWKTIKEDRQPFYGTMTNRRKNGQKYEAAISIAPVLDDEGLKAEYFVAVERDLTRSP